MTVKWHLIVALVCWWLTILRIFSCAYWCFFSLNFINFEIILGLEKNCKNSTKLSVTLSLSSVQFSCSVVSDSLWPHESQQPRPPRPSPAPRVHPDPCPLSRWCHPTTSSSVVPFSSCPQSFPASGSFQMSQLFSSGGQSIKSFSFSISPSNEHPGLISFRMGWLDLLAVQGTLRVFSNTTVQKHQFFCTQLSL